MGFVISIFADTMDAADAVDDVAAGFNSFRRSSFFLPLYPLIPFSLHKEISPAHVILVVILLVWLPFCDVSNFRLANVTAQTRSQYLVSKMTVVFVRTPDGFCVQSTVPASGRRLTGIRLDDGHPLYLIDQRPANTPPFDPHPPRYSLYVPLLKSNLQKAIRRKERDAALRTAWWLLAKEPTELLRRLPVILCEDTQAHAGLLTEIVWLMAATSKGYQLTWSDAAIVMAAVATALETTGQWNLSIPGPSFAGPASGMTPVGLALHVRVSFGGMAGDMAFLRRLRDRAQAGTLPFWTEPVCWLEEDIPWLVPERDILLEAVDQHTYWRLERLIPGLRLEAVWWCRSAVSVRNYVGEGAEEAEWYRTERRSCLQANLEEHELALDLYSRRMIRRADRGDDEEVGEMRKASAAAALTLDGWVTKASRTP